MSIMIGDLLRQRLLQGGSKKGFTATILRRTTACTYLQIGGDKMSKSFLNKF